MSGSVDTTAAAYVKVQALGSALPLGQARGTDIGTVMMWSAGLMLVLMVGLWVATRLKKRMQEPEEPTAVAGFTLSDLRQMHRAGQMTDEEFERAKAKVIAAAQRATERNKAAAAGAVGLGAAGLSGARGFPVIEPKPPTTPPGRDEDDDEDEDSDEPTTRP